MDRVLRVAEFFADLLEGDGIAVVSINVVEIVHQDLEADGVEAAMLIDALAGAILKLIQVPA